MSNIIRVEFKKPSKQIKSDPVDQYAPLMKIIGKLHDQPGMGRIVQRLRDAAADLGSYL